MADDGRIEKARERVRSARADYEAKQDDVHRARERYHDAVRALNEAGMSLREVADALGLSHQRVHQMIGESGDTSSKLRRGARKAAKAGGAILIVLALAAGAASIDAFLTTSTPGEEASPVITASMSPRTSSDSDERRAKSLERLGLFKDGLEVSCARAVKCLVKDLYWHITRGPRWTDGGASIDIQFRPRDGDSMSWTPVKS